MSGKEKAFSILAILLPFVAFVLLEAALRLAGVGFNTKMFVKDELNPRYLVANTEISKKYFSVQENATTGSREPMLAKKGDRTKRFFVLGASTSLGFPYMHNGCFPRMVKYALQFEYPKYNIEVINLSLTAVNTYTLLDFAEKILPYGPDGVIVYTGQNEYYGALGAASGKSKPWFKRLIIKAMELRTIQLLSRLGARSQDEENYVKDDTRTLMERMSRRAAVPFGSETYNAGVLQYRENLEKILRIFAKRNIPVCLCTLASNYKDQYPLDRSEDATKAYVAGRQALERGDKDGAETLFEKAIDLDGIRFRAPREFNGFIREYAARFDNVTLIDVDSIFRKTSANGIIGNELLLEHVHPNLKGHALIAEACLDALRRTVLGSLDTTGGFRIDLRKDYPVTSLDTCFCTISLHQLRTQWPFNEPQKAYETDTSSFEFLIAAQVFYKKINWGQGMQRLNNWNMKREDYGEALKVLEQMCLELPYQKEFFAGAENISYGLGMNAKSDFYGRKAQ